MASEWIDMSPYWDELAMVGAKRDKRKARYPSTKNLSCVSSHTLGLIGEKAVSLQCGLPVDQSIRQGGDGGKDFERDGVKYDVKGVTCYQDPHLKEYTFKTRLADFYIVVGVDVPNRRASIAGWATGRQVELAALRDYGYGPMWSLLPSELTPGLPPGLLQSL